MGRVEDNLKLVDHGCKKTYFRPIMIDIDVLYHVTQFSVQNTMETILVHQGRSFSLTKYISTDWSTYVSFLLKSFKTVKFFLTVFTGLICS